MPVHHWQALPEHMHDAQTGAVEDVSTANGLQKYDAQQEIHLRHHLEGIPHETVGVLVGRIGDDGVATCRRFFDRKKVVDEACPKAVVLITSEQTMAYPCSRSTVAIAPTPAQGSQHQCDSVSTL